MNETKQASVAAYSSGEIMEKVAQARISGWKELRLDQCRVQDNDLRKLLGEPGVERLQRLYLGWNRLSTLPPEIGRLTALMELYLQGNESLGLPPEILGCTWFDFTNQKGQVRAASGYSRLLLPHPYRQCIRPPAPE
jgi:Leucine-rich repeat (LRR) protein